MLIVIDTEEVARSIVADSFWSIGDFLDEDAPIGWSFAILDHIPDYEEAVFNDVKRILEEPLKGDK